MKYKYLLFDLDGTLCDTKIGVQRCFNYALSFFGKEEKDYSVLDDVIGPPILDSLMVRGLSKEDAEKGLEKYRERYNKIGIFEELKVFNGMEEVLRKCKEKGYIISTATSKPEHYAKLILEKLDIAKYFDLIAGASFDESRNTKEKVLEYTMEKLNVKNKSDVLLIGDTKFDFLGAIDVGIDAVGIRFGYAKMGELEMYKNSGIFDTAKELEEFLMKG